MKPLTLLVLLLATPARAEVAAVTEASAFGHAGQWVLQPSTSFGFSTGGWEREDSTFRIDSLGGTLGVARFFTARLTIGMTLSYQEYIQRGRDADIRTSDLRHTTGSLGLTAGWNRPVGGWASFWPQLQGFVGVDRGHDRRVDEGISSETRSKSWSAGVELTAAVLIHPVRHFFFGAGPRLSFTAGFEDALNSHSAQVSLSPFFTLGGWL